MRRRRAGAPGGRERLTPSRSTERARTVPRSALSPLDQVRPDHGFEGFRSSPGSCPATWSADRSSKGPVVVARQHQPPTQPVHRLARLRLGVGARRRHRPAARRLGRRGDVAGPGRPLRRPGPDLRRRLPPVARPARLRRGRHDPAPRGGRLAARAAVRRRRLPGLPGQHRRPPARSPTPRPSPARTPTPPASPRPRCARSARPPRPTRRSPGSSPRRTPTAASRTSSAATRTRTRPPSSCSAPTPPARTPTSVQRGGVSAAALPRLAADRLRRRRDRRRRRLRVPELRRTARRQRRGRGAGDAGPERRRPCPSPPAP